MKMTDICYYCKVRMIILYRNAIVPFIAKPVITPVIHFSLYRGGVVTEVWWFFYIYTKVRPEVHLKQ